MSRARIRRHVYISGMVQGVSFRWYTVQEARARGLGGFVRNLPDGRVEAVFEGPDEAVDQMVAWCRHGPRYARVTRVDVEAEEPEGLFEFDVDV